MAEATVREHTGWYASLLWGSMKSLGVTESVERKIVAAVTIQFAVSVTMVVLPFIVSGLTLYYIMGVLLFAAAVAFYNTILIARRDFVEPITTLEAKADAIANGEVDVSVDPSGQQDEIGSLTNSFVDMTDYLETVSEQAVALSDQHFDDPALDQDVPGEFGDALEQMADNLQSYTEDLQRMKVEAEEKSAYLQRKADEYSDIMQQSARGDLTQRMETDGENEAIDRIGDQFNEMIDELEKTLGQTKNYVSEVEQAGAEVEESAEMVSQASGQVANSIQKISDDAYDQRERLESVADGIDDLKEELDAIDDEYEEEFFEQRVRLEELAERLTEVLDLVEETQAESETVSAAAEEQTGELSEVSQRARELQQYAGPLRDILQEFDTEQQHEFVYSTGSTT